MKLKIILFGLILIVFATCNDERLSFSTDPSDRITFSTDTVSFDTLLATVSSPVKKFMIYNRNKKPLLISSISLDKGSNSPFKINVDGFAGSSFSDIEIRENDSIYVIVDIHPENMGQNDLSFIHDDILFITNGITQKVALVAWGQDVFRCDGCVIETDSVLNVDKPYLVFDSLTVAEGVTLTVPAGAVFYMHNDAVMNIYGTLIMEGTVDQPIIVRGDRTDKLALANPIPYDLIPGQWGYIYFGANSYGNKIENARIRNAYAGIVLYSDDANILKLEIRNTVVTNVSSYLLFSENSTMTAENCEFSNSGGECLFLAGGAYRFTHCTVANYYPSYLEAGWTKSNNNTLLIANALLKEIDGENYLFQYPIYTLFENTIFASINKEAGISVSNPDTTVYLSYTLDNCLLIDEYFENDNLHNCIYGAKPNDLFIDCEASDADGKDFAFDFRLKENSPALDTANYSIAQTLPLDLNGKSRLADGKPDIGAYER